VSEYQDWNNKIIEEFRASGGTAEAFKGANLLLLHHTGAKSGAERVSPLVYMKSGESYVIFGSAAGGPRNPGWYYNLAAHPDATIEVGTSTVNVHARIATPEEREPLWARQKEVAPGFAEYETNAAPRQIPVVLLDPAK
jgi:deazaflavin-dependent oxidoreductase (nitroreductase family)